MPVVMHTNEMNVLLNNLRNKYDLDIESPFSIIANGKSIQFDCLIKGYGAKNGMIVNSEWGKLGPVAEFLNELGYGYSCFNIETASIERFSEVLADWGKISA